MKIVNAASFKPMLIWAVFLALTGQCQGHDGENFISPKRLAVTGDTHAQLELGLAYWEGHHVPKNEKNALDWIIKSASKGSSKA